MKRNILTLALAIVSSVWMTSEAACFPSVHTAALGGMRYYPGKLVKASLPCEPNTDCPTCQALALEFDGTLYFLTPYTEYAQSLLEAIDQQWKENLKANVYGIRFNTGNAMYIEVYGIQVLESGLFALCDEWNVLEVENVLCGGCEVKRTVVHHLASDTIINDIHYAKLMKGNSYEGAMREGIHRDIYYIPNGSTHEYLLYYFDALVGDKLTNLWVGDTIKSATIIEIEPTTPRTFVLSVEYYQSGYLDTTTVAWIEGVGYLAGPTGRPGFMVPNSRAYSILCAYKNGEQVYKSLLGEQCGCVYNDDGNQQLSMFPSDTRWHYMHSEMFGGPNDSYNFTLQPVDTIINNTHYQQIGSGIFRSEGAKVWCLVDSMETLVEYLVYDFDLQVGDSIRQLHEGHVIYESESAGEWYDNEYAKVTNVEYVTLADGRKARRISYDGYRFDDIEHIGSVEGILAPLNFQIPTCGCADHFQCCTYAGILLYEVASGACDTFFVKAQPTDTIPLYSRDDSGSSTVDPVDPNQIYATLTGDKLTVHNNTGAQVTFTLNNTSVNNVAARARKNTEPVSFTESVSVELLEDGIYEILLTSEEWNYTIFGTVNYIRSGTDIIKEESPTTKKVLRGTQILIEREGKTYTLTGQEVK